MRTLIAADTPRPDTPHSRRGRRGWSCGGVAGVTFWLAAVGCNTSTPATEDDDAGDPDDVATTDDDGDDAPVVECDPGTRRCSADSDAIEQCGEDAKTWTTVETCNAYDVCLPCTQGDQNCDGPRCSGPCELSDSAPSSEGCSFVATRVLRLEFQGTPSFDGLVVGNPSPERTAHASLFLIPTGDDDEELIAGPIDIAPYETSVFFLDESSILGTSSLFGTGGVYRLVTDSPVIVYQHAPLQASLSNDASLLLPESGLGRNYVVASYGTHRNGPSYFEAIALHDDTDVAWKPPVPTAGNGLPIKPTLPGFWGTQKMNRFDRIRIAAKEEFTEPDPGGIKGDTPDAVEYNDLSGTIVQSTEAIWVVGGTRCAYIPYRVLFCDHLQELLFPLDYWGTTYVGAPAPAREDEPHVWRLFAGQDGVEIATDPPLPGFPITLEKRGDYREIVVPSGTSTVFRSPNERVFLAVQYLVGSEIADGSGDPSMVQSVPVEQFLSTYTFITGLSYDSHYAQVIREVGGADVFVDDELVTGWLPIDGQFEFSNWPIAEGLHVADSAEPFGVVQFGYGNDASYAYPGGMRREVIFVP